MPKLHPIVKAFSGGEITDLLLGRPDTAGYQTGAEIIQNFQVDPRGVVFRRPGFEYIEDANAAAVALSFLPATYGRTFDFYDGDVGYVVTVTPEWISVNTQAGVASGQPKVPNGNFDLGMEFWTKVEGPLNFNPGSAIPWATSEVEVRSGFSQFPVPPTDAQLYWTVVSQGVVIADASHNHKATFIYRLIEYFNTVKPGGAGFSPTTSGGRIMIGTTLGAGDIFVLQNSAYTQEVNIRPSDFGVLDGETIYLSMGVSMYDDTPNDTIPNIGRAYLDDISFIDTEPVVGAEGPVVFASPYTENDIRLMQYEQAPGLNSGYFVTPGVVPHKVIFNPDSTWTFQTVIFVNESWTTPPGSLTFFDGRLWFGGNVDAPITLYGSQPAISGVFNYENFTLGVAEATDSIVETLAQQGVIRWMRGGTVLHVGTNKQEHKVFGTDGGGITPSNISTRPYSAFGGARVQSDWMSEMLVFTSSDKRKLYLTEFNRDRQDFVSFDITYAAEHITIDLIEDIAYAQNPIATFWVVTNTGKLLSCTYNRAASVIAWARHITDGTVLSITAIEESNRSAVYALINRDNGLFFERLTTNIYMDSSLQTIESVGTSVLPGYTHLKNASRCLVLGDTNFLGEFPVNASGEIDISVENALYTSYVAGLPYKSYLKTLPVDPPNTSIAAYMKGWGKIFLRLIGSVRPMVNGKQLPTRTAPQGMSTSQARATEIVLVANVGRDRDAVIEIETELPYNCQVAGVYGELRQETL